MDRCSLFKKNRVFWNVEETSLGWKWPQNELQFSRQLANFEYATMCYTWGGSIWLTDESCVYLKYHVIDGLIVLRDNFVVSPFLENGAFVYVFGRLSWAKCSFASSLVGPIMWSFFGETLIVSYLPTIFNRSRNRSRWLLKGVDLNSPIWHWNRSWVK